MSTIRLWLFPVFFAIALAAYRNCLNIFIPGDNYSLFVLFQNEGLSGAIRSIGPYLFSMPVVFALWKLFGDHASLWAITSLLLHTANACLVTALATRITSSFHNFRNWIGPIAGLLFLVSPYQTEAVLWTPTDLPIVIATALMLLALHFSLRYFTEKRNIHYFLALGCTLLAVFSYETSLVMAALLFLLFYFYKTSARTEIAWTRFISHIFLPQAGIVAAYFVATKIISGEFIWHGDEFGYSLSPTLLAGNLAKYFAKFFVFYRYLPIGETDSWLRELFANPAQLCILFGFIALAILAFFILLLRQKRQEGALLVIVFVCFIISLIPVLPLDSSFLKYIYPDRYGYFASVFFYMFVSASAFLLLKKIAVPFVVGYLVLCWIFLAQTLFIWNGANKYCNSLTENFKPFQNNETIFVLSAPTYYRGVAAFRSAFRETILLKNNFPRGKVKIVTGCYQEQLRDTIQSVEISGDTVFVQGPKKKTPFFSVDGGWAHSYETPEYSVQFEPDGCAYKLIFKQQIPANSAFIYPYVIIWKKAL